MSGNLGATLTMARNREAAPAEPATITEPTPAPKPVQRAAPGAKPPASERGRGGKSSNPDYQKAGVYILKDLRLKIERHLLGTDEDLSDFVEKALIQATKRLRD